MKIHCYEREEDTIVFSNPERISCEDRGISST